MMKLHDTAAMLLAGWSLLLPPVSRTLRLEMNPDLSKWNVHSTHRTKAECQQERQRLLALAAPPSNPPKSSLRRPGRDALAAQYRSSQCVSSGDPALKSK
jgi:hypothetical protein